MPLDQCPALEPPAGLNRASHGLAAHFITSLKLWRFAWAVRGKRHQRNHARSACAVSPSLAVQNGTFQPGGAQWPPSLHFSHPVQCRRPKSNRDSLAATASSTLRVCLFHHAGQVVMLRFERRCLAALRLERSVSAGFHHITRRTSGSDGC